MFIFYFGKHIFIYFSLQYAIYVGCFPGRRAHLQSAYPPLSGAGEDQMGRDSVVKSRTGGCGPFKSAAEGGI